MPSVLLNDVTSLPDVMLTNLFDLNIPNPPVGDGSALLIRNLSAQLPVMPEIAVVPVTSHRHTSQYAGKAKRHGSFTASYIDTSDRKVIATIEGWYQAVLDPATGLPKRKSNYTCLATVSLHDVDSRPSVARTFKGLWISNVTPVNLGNDDTPVQYQITFQYDYFDLF